MQQQQQQQVQQLTQQPTWQKQPLPSPPSLPPPQHHEQQQSKTFQQAIARVLYMARIFALFPVCNLCTRNVHRLRYAWFSWPTFYTTLIITLNALEFSTVVNLVFMHGVQFHSAGTVSLYVVCGLEQVFFWRLATKWPYIMRCWRQVEEIFLRSPYRNYAATFNMKRRINAYSFIFMFAALVEHSLLVYNSFRNSQLEHTQCNLTISFWESLYKRERFHLSLVLPFHGWLLPLFEWINLTLAFARSFTDAFIICISIGLVARFRQLFLRIADVHTKAMPALFWTEIRTHYLTLKQLLRLVNGAIAPLILLSCSNNMYFICFQLFNSFQNIGVDLFAELAFWYSLMFAILRTLLTLYVASTVHEYNKRLLATLRDVPSSSWCLEIQRFSEQLSVDLTALSGDGFFYMTRKLIIAMVSSIVTYELMVTDVINKGSIRQRTNYCRNVEY